MSTVAGTQSRLNSTSQVTRDDTDTSSPELPVTTRLLDAEPEPFPYTKVRDWITLLSQVDLPDGAFRLYCVSRSVIWENSKGGPPARPIIEISYEEYGLIMGRSAKTISRLAASLYAIGLWEEVERTSRSVRIPGKARPEVRTVLTIRVHDYPRDPRNFEGPVKTWDKLSEIREARKRGPATGDTGSDVFAGECDGTAMSAHTDQATGDAPTTPPRPTSPGPSAEPGVSAGQCAETDLSGHTDQRPAAIADESDHDTPAGSRVPPAQTPEPPGGTARTDLSEAETDLSADLDVSAGQSTCDGPLKKTGFKEEKPSLPPPSAAAAAKPAALDDELAMFSDEAIELVAQLYARAMSLPGAQPLSAADRVGLARRIDSRITEGWSLTRVRQVLNGGSLDGVRMPGRLWAARLDDMPAFPRTTSVPAPRDGHCPAPPQPPARPSLPGRPTTAAAFPRTTRPHSRTNDCSDLPDPNPGKARYEIPDPRGVRMTVVWADDRTVKPWCGHCSGDTRCLRPRSAGALARPCPDCHPDPAAFPTLDEDTPTPAGTNAP